MSDKYFECQDLHGGKMPFLNVDENGKCNHPACAQTIIENLQQRIADLEEQWTDMSHKVYDYARALDEILIIADFLLKKFALNDNHFFVLQTKKIFQLANQAREK